MKTLMVLRHAKASQEDRFAVDFDRPLTPRGRKQALALGRMMRASDLAFDAIVASPAVRVVETIAGVMEGIGARFDPVYDRRLYSASPKALIEVIQGTDDKVGRLLIVGHNPGLHQLLLSLAQDDREGLRGDIASGYPTATLAELCFAVDRWRDVGPRSGSIVSLIRPED